jgi:hypothetical protein
MAFRADYFLHHGRFHPCTFGYRRSGCAVADNSRPKNFLVDSNSGNGIIIALYTRVIQSRLTLRIKGEIMNIVRKCMALFGIGALGAAGIMLYVKLKRDGRQAGTYENLGKNIDEKLNASKAALDKASSHVQSVFEHIKNRKP